VHAEWPSHHINSVTPIGPSSNLFGARLSVEANLLRNTFNGEGGAKFAFRPMTQNIKNASMGRF